MQYNVSVSAVTQPGKTGNLNLNVQVDAPNVIAALDAARAQLEETLSTGGLVVKDGGK